MNSDSGPAGGSDEVVQGILIGVIALVLLALLWLLP
jgi:hypothetical protein